MRVLLASTGGSGHVGPLLPVLSVLVRRGDEVLLVVPPALAGTARGTGQPYLLGKDPPQAELGSLWERFAVADPDEQAVLANRELFARLCTTAMLPTLEGAFAWFRPDLVVREPCEYASAVVAEQRGVRHVQVAIGLAEVERASLELAAPVLRSFRPDLRERLLAAPYLTRLPAALDPSPFPTTLRVRDPAPPDRPRPLPDWWAGSTDPLVYLTLGTVAGSLPEATELYRAALAASDGLAVRVLVTLGHDGDATSLGTLPANVHAEKWVPQRDVPPWRRSCCATAVPARRSGRSRWGCRSSSCRCSPTNRRTAGSSHRPGQGSSPDGQRISSGKPCSGCCTTRRTTTEQPRSVRRCRPSRNYRTCSTNCTSW